MAPLLAVGTAPSAIAAGDFNGDGKVDLIVAARDEAAMEVLAGKGTGSFSIRVGLAVVGSPASALTVGDFDGDGFLDFAAVSTTGSSVTLLFGKGDLTFSAPVTVAAGISPAGVAAAGGRLAVTDAHDNSVLMFDVSAARSITPSGQYVVGNEPRAIATADFNGDGRADFVVANHADRSVSVLLAVDTGGFSVAPPVAVGNQPVALAVGDIDKDGRPDAAVANGGDGTVTILLGDGQGGLRAGPPLDTGPDPVALAIAADTAETQQVVTGDGIPDLLVATAGADRLDVFAGSGNGTFIRVNQIAAGSGVVGLVMGQFDQDAAGAVDLVMATATREAVVVMQGSTNGAFIGAPLFEMVGGVTDVAVGDADGDGALDVLVAAGGADSVTVMRGDGVGGLRAPATAIAGPNPIAMAAGDFRGDHHLNLAVSNGGTNRLSILSSQLTGGTAPPQSVVLDGEARALAAADLNHDGLVDLIVAQPAASQVTVLFAHADGTFTSLDLNPGGSPVAVGVGDCNGDGRPDVVAAVLNPPSLVTWLLSPAGAPSGQVVTQLSDVAGVLAIADFDGDGVADVVVAGPTTGTMAIYHGRGDGSFEAAGRLYSPASPVAMVAADFNRDGRMDVLIAIPGTDEVVAYAGDGAGGFSSGARFAVGRAPVALAVGDLDGDRLPDVLVADGGGADVVLLQNTTHVNVFANTPTPIPRGQGASSANGPRSGGGCGMTPKGPRANCGGILLALLGGYRWWRRR